MESVVETNEVYVIRILRARYNFVIRNKALDWHILVPLVLLLIVNELEDIYFSMPFTTVNATNHSYGKSVFSRRSIFFAIDFMEIPWFCDRNCIARCPMWSRICLGTLGFLVFLPSWDKSDFLGCSNRRTGELLLEQIFSSWLGEQLSETETFSISLG